MLARDIAPPFSEGATRIWAIPAGEPFLTRLAQTLADVSGLKNNPEALAKDLIYVPNRRSARALAVELYRAAGGVSILPPDIRALGDLDTDEPPSGAEEAITDLGPALPPARRLGALARLVAAFYEARGDTLPVISALAAARELTRLLDQAALSSGVDWSKIPDLVEDTDLAAHWQDSAEFLSIVTAHWPDWLSGNGATEPYERRLKVAEAIARAVAEQPPDGRFIIAGSTGATPASQILMQAATKLDLGIVVLPGLDHEAPEATWQAISEEPDHPQYALFGTLQALEKSPSDIPVWPGASTPGLNARRRLIHESLAPATRTADWLSRLQSLAKDRPLAEFADEALTGLSLIEAADETDEALLCALLLRQTLETEGRTAALVTPDASLARRVSANLKRWNITVHPTAGVPLGRTPAGSLLLLVLKWLEDTGDPVHLLAVLKHPLVEASDDGISALDRYILRGPRRWHDLSDLAARITALIGEKNKSRHSRIPDQAGSTAKKLADRLAALPSNPVDIINQLTGSETRAWSGADGSAAAATLEAAMEIMSFMNAGEKQPLREVVEALAATTTVQSSEANHPRLSIWGPLEARLQQADRVILAGLNEEIWPDRPAADGFLPRRFRGPLGLPSPEARLGLAAHDFAGLATAPNVVLTYAARRDDAPAVASRWVLRLRTLVQGALGREADAALSPNTNDDSRPWAAALTASDRSQDPTRSMPRPTPLASARPTQLSVTRINTLQRDPYTIYAESVLRLKKLRPIGEPIDASARGTAIHAAIEAFGEDPKTDQTQARLTSLIEQQLAVAGQPEHLIASERASLAVAIQGLFDWWQHRQDQIDLAASEVRGKLPIKIGENTFTLTAVADRIDRRVDGAYAILDFKTGRIPTKKEINAGFEQQLPLQAFIARAGQFGGLPPAEVTELGYVGVKFNFENVPIASDAAGVDVLADEAQQILERLITAYMNPLVPYLSVPRIQLKSAYEGDFDRLARRSEWAGEVDDG